MRIEFKTNRIRFDLIRFQRMAAPQMLREEEAESLSYIERKILALEFCF
jgi:hypothetical protein